jgi:molybdopterin molybdotransferase
MTGAPDQGDVGSVTASGDGPQLTSPSSGEGEAPEPFVGHAPHTWFEAHTLAFECAAPIPAAPVPLSAALGRILASDVLALQDLPHYASSAMDGWAVNGSGPWILAEPGQRLAPHQASPIVTGGLLPPGAKAVLRSESGEIGQDDDGLPILVLGGRAKPGEPQNGQHIRNAGEEAASGEVLVKAGTVLTPAHVALAAVAGHDELNVLGKPVVKLVLTGSEVVTSGLPAPGQVRDTFGPQLGSVVGMVGGLLGEQVRVGDSYAEWLAALEDQDPGAAGNPTQGAGPSGLQNEAVADVVITTGGTGRSGTDHFRQAVEELGGRLLIDGIAMRPGHPTMLAELPDGRFMLGLPGNPLAAMMALFTVGSPLLAALGSAKPPALGEVPCGAMIDPDPGRTRLMPFRLLYGLASPAGHSGPGMMRGLAAADGVMIVPPHGVQMGEPVQAFALPWGPPLPVKKPAEGKRTSAGSRAGGSKRQDNKDSGPVDWSALE